jgi:iron complex outermembrane receptor protein
MDLPLTLADIERIEVLRGGGSSLYGPNALGGVINIITKEPEKREGELKLSFGDYALSQEAVSLSFPFKKFKNRISFEKKKSEGYIENTEFDITTLSLNSQIGSFGLSFGLTDKEFGADSFYSNLYPQEYEETKTRFAQIRTKVKKGRITLEPKIYYRKHWDKFILDRTRPDWYVNYHTTYLYGGEIQSRILSPFGSFVFGGEIGGERIESTNLGDHSRLREALYLEFSRKTQDKLFLNLGVRGDHYSDWEWEGSPSLSLGYKVSPSLKLRTSLGRSFRVPTFTDL